ncbi:MAG: hypothetical protein AB1397_06165 [bacterium]
MNRTTILLPEKLKWDANLKARGLGLSLGEFIRTSLEQALKKDFSNLKNDPFVKDNKFYSKNIERDLSLKHDNYIYEKAE